MCILVTLAANRPLPTYPFDPEYRHIAVVDLAARVGATYYARLLSLPYAYDVTSRYGCGCGLQVTPEDIATLAEAASPAQYLKSIRAALEDFQHMVDLVEIGLDAGPVEIFTCWDSECFTVQVESRLTATLAQLRQPGFPLVDRQVVTVAGTMIRSSW
jgi:hypothetical protein